MFIGGGEHGGQETAPPPLITPWYDKFSPYKYVLIIYLAPQIW